MTNERAGDESTVQGHPTRRVLLGGALGVAGVAVLGGCNPGVLLGPDAIQLNNTPNGATPKTLNLRRNATQTISIPEWTSSMHEPTESPVCYSLAGIGGGSIIIKARFRAYYVHEDGTSEPWSGQVQIRATGGGILGAIDPVIVNMVSGVSDPEYVTFTLAHHGIGVGVGVRGVMLEDIAWTWEVLLPGAADFTQIGATHHRVYVVYRKPREPWDNTVGSALNAWTDALDFACSITGGTGATDDLDEITNALAGLFNSGGGPCDLDAGSASTTAARLMYDTNSAGSQSSYYSWATGVNLTKFLERWRGGDGNGPLVDCSDCAALFSTLANLLGANLWQGQIFPGLCVPVMPIGCGSWWLNGASGYVSASGVHASQTLNFHEIAWKGDVALGSLVWDVCFMLNSLQDPANLDQPNTTSRVASFAWGIPYSGTANTLDYREMLSDPGNVVNALPDYMSKVRRTPV